MDAITNAASVILPFIIFVIYCVGLFYLIKMIIYVMRLPKQIAAMTERIKQLEEKEKK
ncbi:MAG TPA: hypothetical protein VGO98_01335 [Candidatus Saccharimonadales bacterium]|jgi:hypothetical protein|nr:hypothetical protein [Candidatus Saccharimonadales bacterium]